MKAISVLLKLSAVFISSNILNAITFDYLYLLGEVFVGLGCSMVTVGMINSRGLVGSLKVSFSVGVGGSTSMEMAMAGARIWNLLRFIVGLVSFVVGVSIEMLSTSESVRLPSTSKVGGWCWVRFLKKSWK